MDLRLDRLAIEEQQLLAVLGRLVDPGAELLDLLGLVGDAQATGLLEVAVDAVRSGEGDEGREVRDAFLLEPRDLVGEVADPVRKAVGQRRLAEAAVPAGRPEPDRLLLEDVDAQRGIRVGQRERGPQAGEPAADDRDVRRPRRGAADGPARPATRRASS